MPDEVTPGRATLAAFYATVLIGGLNFVSVKFSNAELPPMFGAAVRFAAAALIFFAIAGIRRMALPKGRALGGASLYGILNFGLGYALLYIALVGLAAGTASVILAMVPLITLILAVLHRQERFTSRGLVGGLLAIAGIAVLSFRSIGDEIPIPYLLASLGGAFAASEASVLVKGFPRAHPITTNAVGMTVGAAGLVVASLVLGESWLIPEQPRTWAALTWLVVAGSVGLFGLFLFVIKNWTASASVYAITLMPLVAVTTGTLLANEPLRPEVIAGGILVILGVYVGALAPTRKKPPVAVPEPAPAPAASAAVQRVAEGCAGTGLISVEEEQAAS